MRRFVPILLCLVLALSGWCTFTCFTQAAAKDAHACCHGKSKSIQHGMMVAQSQPPAAVQHAAPANPVSAATFAAPVTTLLQPQRAAGLPVFRSLPPLILRI